MRPSKVSVRPSGQARARTLTKCARQGWGAPAARNSSSTRAIAAPKSLDSPAQRAERTPGASPSASTQSPEIVGKRGRPRSPRRRLGLQRGVVAEGEAGLLRLDEAQLGRADGLDAVGPQELADFPQLAGVVGRRDDPSREAAKRARGLSVRIHSATIL